MIRAIKRYLARRRLAKLVKRDEAYIAHRAAQLTGERRLTFLRNVGAR